MHRGRSCLIGILCVTCTTLGCATRERGGFMDPVNTDPIANDDQTTTSQGVPVTVTVTANDTDPDGNQIRLTEATLETSVPGGAITTDTDKGTITVDPGPSFVGTIEVSYRIVDDGAPPGFATGTLIVTVVAGNPPVAVDDQATTQRGVPVTVDVLANDSDPEGGTLSTANPIFLDTPPPAASIQLNSDQSLTIDPGPGFVGTFRVGYTVRDPTGLEASGQVTITVLAPPPATSVRVDVVDDSGDPLGGGAAGFRIGDGAWMPLTETTPGRYDIEVPDGESRWGITARYGDVSQTIEATTDEATSARMTFRNPSVMAVDFGFTWNGVDNIATGTPSVILYGLGGFVTTGGGASGASTVPTYPARRQDFILIGTDNGVPAGADINRDVTPTQAGTIDFSFTAADMGGTTSVSPFSIPAGASGSFLINYTTGAGVAPVGNGSNTGGVAYTFPASQTDPATDFYVATAAASTSGATLVHSIVSRPPFQSDNAVFDVPDSFYFVNAPVASANPTFTDLESNDPNHQMFNLTIGHSGPSPTIMRQYLVTQGWLGIAQAPPPIAAEAALITSYTISDPTALPGFEDFGFDSGDSVAWSVTRVSNNMLIGDVLNAAVSTGVPLIAGLSQTSATAAGIYMVP